jgi:hypothetical protein
MRIKNSKKVACGLGALKRDFGPPTVAKMLSSYRLGEEMTGTSLAKKLCISSQLLCEFQKGRRLVGHRRAYEFGKKLGRLPCSIASKCTTRFHRSAQAERRRV